MSLARQYAYPGPAGEQRAFNTIPAQQPTGFGMPLQQFQPPQQQVYTGHRLGMAVTAPVTQGATAQPMLYRAYRKNKSRKSRKNRSRKHKNTRRA
jgi:hypothetical protein